MKRQEREDEIKRQEREDELEKLKIEASMMKMANLIAREPEEKANDYEHIKGMLLKRSKLSKEAFKVSEVQVAEVKVVEDESKIVTARFNGEVVRENKKCSAVQLKMSDLKIVKISYGGTEYEAVVDSGAQISVFKSSVVGKEVDYKGHIMLHPAFGDCLKAELKEVDIGLVTNGYITPVIKTVVATVDGLNTDILLDTETYEALLEQERIYSPRFTAAMNLRSDSSKKSLDESVNTEEEEQEPTITEYDEENGNNTEKIKKQQQICDTLQEVWHFARRNKGGYVIENDILYHEELLGEIG
ncbi:retrovirus-related Pol polyprotein from transposon opus [Trichonephila clavipes]|nr:retrovirus-related Pol polyprotein from transposon opus [Trichonephila clavipes]